MHSYSYGKGKLSLKKKKKIIGIISIGLGVLTILYFFFPLISYHLYLSSAFAENDIKAPLPQRLVLGTNTSIKGLVSHGFSNVTSDYRDARNWFPQIKKDVEELEKKKISEYQLSIPSQGVDHMNVSASDFDLSKNLVQYFTTSKNPVDRGTSVIFGHSTLPQWFNPKNYMSVFAKLHLLKEGDEIILTVDGKDYIYKIFTVAVVDTDDPNIFSQAYDNSYITVVTCTPPGTTWKRLIVRASLQQS